MLQNNIDKGCDSTFLLKIHEKYSKFYSSFLTYVLIFGTYSNLDNDQNFRFCFKCLFYPNLENLVRHFWYLL